MFRDNEAIPAICPLVSLDFLHYYFLITEHSTEWLHWYTSLALNQLNIEKKLETTSMKYRRL